VTNPRTHIDGVAKATGQSCFQRYTTAGERRVVNRLIDAALAAGYSISVCDDHAGEGDWVLRSSTSKRAIQNSLASTDGDLLRVRAPLNDGQTGGQGRLIGVVQLVWGNAADGSEVISDHSDNDETNALVATAYGQEG